MTGGTKNNSTTHSLREVISNRFSSTWFPGIFLVCTRIFHGLVFPSLNQTSHRLPLRRILDLYLHPLLVSRQTVAKRHFQFLHLVVCTVVEAQENSLFRNFQSVSPLTLQGSMCGNRLRIAFSIRSIWVDLNVLDLLCMIGVPKLHSPNRSLSPCVCASRLID